MISLIPINITGGTDLPDQNIKTHNKFDFSNRTYILTYSNSFGNSKLKSSRERQTGSEEERNRVNKYYKSNFYQHKKSLSVKKGFKQYVAVWTGLEPATPCVTGMYSNQLNYQTLFYCECKYTIDFRLRNYFITQESKKM